MALLGVVTFGLGPGPYIAALAAVGALAVVGYVRNAPTDLGLTGETALLLNMAPDAADCRAGDNAGHEGDEDGTEW